MRKNLSSEEVDHFLKKSHIGMMGTLYRDGSTLLSPVSYVWIDGGFSVGIPRDDIKVRHLQRDPRVSMCVAESMTPYRGVHIRTVGHLLEDEVRVLEMTQRMAHEHLGEEKAKAYTEARVGAQGLILRIEPGEMRSWDFSDTPGLGET